MEFFLAAFCILFFSLFNLLLLYPYRCVFNQKQQKMKSNEKQGKEKENIH